MKKAEVKKLLNESLSTQSEKIHNLNIIDYTSNNTRFTEFIIIYGSQRMPKVVELTLISGKLYGIKGEITVHVLNRFTEVLEEHLSLKDDTDGSQKIGDNKMKITAHVLNRFNEVLESFMREEIKLEDLPKKHQEMIKSFEYQDGLIDDCIGKVYLKEGILWGGKVYHEFPIENNKELREFMKGCEWKK